MGHDESLLHVEDGRDRTTIRCRDGGRARIDDRVWWQGSKVLLTPWPMRGKRQGIDFDIVLERLDWPHSKKAKLSAKTTDGAKERERRG